MEKARRYSFLTSKFHPVYAKIINMISQKSCIENPHGGGWFSRELNIFVLFLGLISFSNLIFSNNTFALFTPTLSASVDNAAASVNGNQVINSANKTTEIPLNLTVNTNNKTGYTATLNSETDETALVNIGSTSGAKINSISSAGLLGDFSNNTWGYKFSTSSSYAPIPALSIPAQILQTAGKTNGNESSQLSIGMKLGDNLESGRYTNKLIFSILTNNYNRIAIMTEGPDFNAKLKSLGAFERFKKSPVAPATSMNVVNIEDEESDYEIKLWFNSTDKTAYYYAEPEKVYLNEDSSRMFRDLSNLISLDVSSFDTSKVTNMEAMFAGMSNLTSLNLSNFDTSKVTRMNSMFEGVSRLTTLNLSNFDTSKVTNMEAMFGYMYGLTSLNISSFDTSQATNMRDMFSNMRNLTSLNLSNFNTSKVTDMRAMFGYMYGLSSLNLTNFDTSKVTDMNSMFAGMSLTSLNLSNFNTSKVTDMGSMFYNMRNLTSLNLTNFDTSKVTDMSDMFSNMFNLTTLDISNFDTSNVIDMGGIFSFRGVSAPSDKLEKIYVNNDFNTSKLTWFSNMFTNRKRLRGGNGSYLSNPATADKTWLRVDRPGVHGYFTRKP